MDFGQATRQVDIDPSNVLEKFYQARPLKLLINAKSIAIRSKTQKLGGSFRHSWSLQKADTFEPLPTVVSPSSLGVYVQLRVYTICRLPSTAERSHNVCFYNNKTKSLLLKSE